MKRRDNGGFHGVLFAESCLYLDNNHYNFYLNERNFSRILLPVMRALLDEIFLLGITFIGIGPILEPILEPAAPSESNRIVYHAHPCYCLLSCEANKFSTPRNARLLMPDGTYPLPSASVVSTNSRRIRGPSLPLTDSMSEEKALS